MKINYLSICSYLKWVPGLSLVSLFLCFWGFGSVAQRQAPLAVQPVVLSQQPGAVLYRIDLKGNNQVYIQTFDLKLIQIEQLPGELSPSRSGKGIGRYYRGEGKSDSPYFTMRSPVAVLNEYRQRTGNALIGLMNASFFEDYQDSSRLSFPIKIARKVVTGGSSPYGPVAQPADLQYRSVRLKALTWSDSNAKIVDYDPATGQPLADSTVTDAMVSYEYRDHPAYRLAKDPPNRYHIVGTFDCDGKPGDEMLAIATSNRATLDATAEILRQEPWNIRDPLMTFDGGTSVYLYRAETGLLLNAEGVGAAGEATLPHFLGFRRKASDRGAQ